MDLQSQSLLLEFELAWRERDAQRAALMLALRQPATRQSARWKTHLARMLVDLGQRLAPEQTVPAGVARNASGGLAVTSPQSLDPCRIC